MRHHIPWSHFSTRSRYGQNGFSFHRFSHLTANPWEMPIRQRVKGTNSRKGKTKNSQIKISQLNGWWFSYWKRCAIPPPPTTPPSSPASALYSIWTTPFCGEYGVNGRPTDTVMRSHNDPICVHVKHFEYVCTGICGRDKERKATAHTRSRRRRRMKRKTKHYEWPNLHKWS